MIFSHTRMLKNPDGKIIIQYHSIRNGRFTVSLATCSFPRLSPGDTNSSSDANLHELALNTSSSSINNRQQNQRSWSGDSPGSYEYTSTKTGWDGGMRVYTI